MVLLKKKRYNENGKLFRIILNNSYFKKWYSIGKNISFSHNNANFTKVVDCLGLAPVLEEKFVHLDLKS